MRRNGKTCHSKRSFLFPGPLVQALHDKWALRDYPRALAGGYSNRDLVEPRNQVMFPRVLKVCKQAQGCIISR